MVSVRGLDVAHGLLSQRSLNSKLEAAQTQTARLGPGDDGGGAFRWSSSKMRLLRRGGQRWRGTALAVLRGWQHHSPFRRARLQTSRTHLWHLHVHVLQALNGFATTSEGRKVLQDMKDRQKNGPAICDRLMSQGEGGFRCTCVNLSLAFTSRLANLPRGTSAMSLSKAAIILC